MRRIRNMTDLDPDAGAGYFKKFYAQFDTAIMGRKSYDQAGGGEVFGSLAAAGLVDTVEIGLAPVLLGGGRKVMAGCDRRIKLIPRPSELELPVLRC